MKKNIISGLFLNRKMLTAVAAVTAGAVLLAACGSRGEGTASSVPSDGKETGAYTTTEEAYWDGDEMLDTGMYEEAAAEAATASESASTAAGGAELALRDDKLVYTCHLSLQTLEYAESAAAIRDAVKKYEGIIESETETNDGYRWGDLYWYEDDAEGERNRLDLYLTARIPTESYDAFVEEVSGIGKLLSKTQSTDNISRAYYDTETHIKALEIEEERLLEMMNKAETIEEMILVEERLTEVQNTLNCERGWLADMDSDIAYSTVTIELREVREYTPGATDPDPSFGERIRDSFQNSIAGFVHILEGILHVIILLWPFIVIGLVVFLVIRHQMKKRRAKRMEQ